jgi:hypothetical protein
VEKIHKRVKASGFKKTEFALALMMCDTTWEVPPYISNGLKWLSQQLSPSRIAVPIAGLTPLLLVPKPSKTKDATKGKAKNDEAKR